MKYYFILYLRLKVFKFRKKKKIGGFLNIENMTGLKYFHKSMKQETLPHTVSLAQDHEISVPRHQRYPSSCCNLSVGLRGGVSQDHPDSHTSGSCSLMMRPDSCCCSTRSVTRAIHLATSFYDRNANAEFCSNHEAPTKAACDF